ncbi:hypothetical protein HMI55_006382 [Coelomomyces lativittatus]|nr:hypothetical protein HMI55_006382 [Coelomomyces lativittatus]
MNSPIPSSTLFSEATFDLIIPESLIEKPLDNLECSRITQREFVFFDEILTLYLCVSIPRLDASTSEATRISMLEHWVTSLDVNTQSIIHNGSDAIPRSSSLSLSKLPITPLSQTSPTSPMSPDSALTDSSSLMQSPSDNSQENIGLNSSDSSIPRKFSTPSKFDVGPSGRGYAEHPSFRQYHYTYNRRAPGCKPLVHPSGTILIPLRVPVDKPK